MVIMRVKQQDGSVVNIPIGKGADGEDGLSAYEIWLQQGNTGSEEDFLESLKGAKGKNGTSVTIESISESTEDDGSNVVTFSDGNTLTIQNGSQGVSGVYVGAGEMPEGYNIQINPEGDSSVDFLTEEDKAEIIEQTQAVCVAKNQGVSNVGKILVVGTDGNLTLTNMPEGGASGDVTGVLDESNNILLSGNLADGTYILKYENTDGTYTTVGTLEVGAIPEPEPAYINQIPISTNADGSLFVGANSEQGYKTGYRLSLSAGIEKALEGYAVTGFIPAKLGDVIRIKDIAIAEDNNINICFYDSNKQPINGGTGTYGTPLYSAFVTNGTEANGIYTTTLYERVHAAVGADFAYIRIGSTQITADSILTVNQEIV